MMEGYRLPGPWMENPMSTITTPAALPTVPPEVVRFAAESGVSEYLYPVLELAHSIFPGRPMTVLLERDPEMADDWHIVFEVDVTNVSEDDIFAGQRRWSAEIFQRCPSTHACIFRLGLTATS
jgi:hypothetical protein